MPEVKSIKEAELSRSGCGELPLYNGESVQENFGLINQ